MNNQKLVVDKEHAWLAGVCAGIANYFGISRLLVRILFVIFGHVGLGIIAYIVLAICMQKE